MRQNRKGRDLTDFRLEFCFHKSTSCRSRARAGIAMWSRLLALALLLLPAPALAGVKEKVATLAPSGLVLVMDAKGNELVAQNVDEPIVPASRHQDPHGVAGNAGLGRRADRALHPVRAVTV